MTLTVSTKFRAIGGASVLALTAGLSGTAIAQSAPAPVAAAPTPTAPAAPANAEECAVADGVLVCMPGTDADGFFDATGTALGLDVQDGAVVQDSVIVTGALTGTVDGAIVTTGDFGNALLAGTGSNVTVNGYVATSGRLATAIETETNSSVTVNGTVYAAGDLSSAIGLNSGSTATNNGLVQTDGVTSAAILAFGEDVTVNNSVTGSIITSGQGSDGVEGSNGLTVNNDGLIQTFAIQSNGILGGDNSTVTNTGNIVALGNSLTGVSLGDNAVVNNSGLIATTGRSAGGVSVGDNSSVTNSDTISTAGDTLSDAVVVGAGSTVTNSGTIAADGDDSFAVFGLGDGVSVTNTATGSILTNGAGGFAVSLLNDAVVQNDGTIETTGTASFGVDVFDGSSVTNNGNISTAGDQAVGVSVGDNSAIISDGTISTLGDDAIGIIAGDASTIDLTSNSVLSTEGDNAGGVVVLGLGRVNNSGSITTLGDGAQAITFLGDGTVGNTGLIDAAQARAIDIGGLGTVTNTATNVIRSGGGDAIRFGADGSSVTNDGTIESNGGGGFAVNADGLNDIVIANTGTISTSEDAFIAIQAADGLDVTNSGTISSFFVGVSAGEGLSLDNAAGGSITSQFGPAVAAGDGTVITNAGLIQSAESNAIEATTTDDTFTVTNSGSIISTAGGFGLVFDNGSVTNEAGGAISGDLAGISSAGDGSMTVVNFGSITGAMDDAVQLGDGDDAFQQWTGASVTGNIDLGDGDDSFILEGSASSVGGSIIGGAGADAAIIAGLLDADNFAGFETFQVGSLLGGTLNDAVISGDRTLDGDVTIVGNVTLGLGVDTLTSTGAMTLEDTSTITIETPLDRALVGQTVLVLQEGTVFTDNGATINIIDDDLLIEYVPVFGSLSVQVNAVDPLVTSGDANVVAFGAALNGGLNAGTLSQANFDAINALPDADALEVLALDALPSLSDGAAREIFETSSAASQALNRHLSGDGSGIWGQFIVRGAEQDGIGASSGGYDSNQLIFTVGGDVALGDMARVGLLASYADIENDDFTGNAARGQTEVESYKLGAYASVSLGERGFLNGEVAYLTGEVEDSRTGLLGTIGSDYDFDGFAYSATLGFDLLADENVSVTPSIGINGASLNFDDAVETGGFGFAVARDDADFTELRGGIELAALVSPKVSGFVSGTIVHDLSDDPRSFTLSSTELSTFTVALPGRENDRFELAAGASIAVSETFSIDLGYLGDFNSGYTGHAGRASVRIAF